MLQKRFFLDNEIEDNVVFDLVAIHSPVEDFFLAFKLNEVLNSLLFKVIEERDAKDSTPFFSRFVWEQHSTDFVWELIANHFFYQEKEEQTYEQIVDEKEIFKKKFKKKKN